MEIIIVTDKENNIKTVAVSDSKGAKNLSYIAEPEENQHIMNSKELRLSQKALLDLGNPKYQRKINKQFKKFLERNKPI